LIERLVRKSQFIRSISGKLEYAMSLTNGESRRAVYSVIELLDERVGDEEESHSCVASIACGVWSVYVAIGVCV
jgi:hypothetical protein